MNDILLHIARLITGVAVFALFCTLGIAITFLVAYIITILAAYNIYTVIWVSIVLILTSSASLITAYMIGKDILDRVL